MQCVRAVVTSSSDTELTHSWIGFIACGRTELVNEAFAKITSKNTGHCGTKARPARRMSFRWFGYHPGLTNDFAALAIGIQTFDLHFKRRRKKPAYESESCTNSIRRRVFSRLCYEATSGHNFFGLHRSLPSLQIGNKPLLLQRWRRD